MHIGLSRPPTPPHPTPDVDAAIIARIAEDFGFESIFYGEHPITPAADQGHKVHSLGVPFYQDLLVALARASAVTSRIKLGGGVFLLAEHHAVMFAKQLASLDFYSKGRLLVGVGYGWSRIECEAMGGNFDRRVAQVRESILLMKKLWSQEITEHDGEFYKLEPVYLYPKPATRSGPPILLPGPRWEQEEAFDTPKMIKGFSRIVSYADGWYPYLLGDEQITHGAAQLIEGRKVIDRLCAEAGRDPKEIQTTALLRIDIHDQDVTMPPMIKRDVLRTYEDAGIDRVAITMPTVISEEHAREVLETMAEALL